MNEEKLTEILGKYQADQSAIIAVLQDIQEEFGYLPKEAIQDGLQGDEHSPQPGIEPGDLFQCFQLGTEGETSHQCVHGNSLSCPGIHAHLGKNRT